MYFTFSIHNFPNFKVVYFLHCTSFTNVKSKWNFQIHFWIYFFTFLLFADDLFLTLFQIFCWVKECATYFQERHYIMHPAYGNWLKFAQDPNTFSLLYAKVVRALHSSSGKVVWYTILYCGCQWQAQSNILSEQLFWSRVHFFFPPHTLSFNTAANRWPHTLTYTSLH